MSRTHYVLGFAFATGLNDVLLIEKARPAWQAGKLNGLGGHIEFRECPREAMVREFREETRLFTERSDWRQFAVMYSNTWEVVCYQANFSYAFLRDAIKTTDEAALSD